MRRMDKPTIAAICVAAGLVLLLIVMLICGGCIRRQNADTPSPSKNTQQTGDTTDNTGDNADATGDETDGTGSVTPTGGGNGGTGNGGTGNGGTGNGGIGDGLGDADDFDNDGDDNGETPTASTGSSSDPTEETEEDVADTPNGSSTSATESETQAPTKPDGTQGLTYEEYWAMTGPEQRAYKNTFPSTEAFKAWLKAAKEAYDDKYVSGMDDLNIDIGDLINKNKIK